MMLSLDTAYRSFGGEVEASSTPTICRLSDSRRHQLWAIAPARSVGLETHRTRFRQTRRACRLRGGQTTFLSACSRSPDGSLGAAARKPADGCRNEDQESREN